MLNRSCYASSKFPSVIIWLMDTQLH